MNWIKILLINFVVFILLLLFVEIGLRMMWTGYQCFKGDCNFTRLYKISIYDSLNEFLDINLGLTKYDQELGYKPNPGFDKIINAKGWNSKYVSIDKNGFRNNNPINKSINQYNGAKILAVGDSFTFGDQVSNDETWTACLEKKAEKNVINAGVPGYGAAQSVKRASYIIRDFNIDTIILSIFLNDDFHRDQKIYLSGFPRPAVINFKGDLKYSKIPYSIAKGTKFNPSEVKLALAQIKNNSMLGSKIIDKLQIDLSGKSRIEVHPDSATIDEIIKFTISEFEKLDVKNKFILFQYGKHDMFDKNYPIEKTQKIRELVTSALKDKDIIVIDSYTTLFLNEKKGVDDIWFAYAHHTTFGNDLVCNEIFQEFKNNSILN